MAKRTSGVYVIASRMYGVNRERANEVKKKESRFDGGDAIQWLNANIKPHITNNEYITINKVINNNQMLRLSLYFKLNISAM